MSKATYRRLAGLVVGGLIGLFFALVATMINSILMPDIPFYMPPFGPIGNAAAGLTAGMLLGLVSAWTDASVPGPIYAAALGALLLLISGLIFGQTPLFLVTAGLVTSLFLMLPFGAMVLPLTALVRVAVNQLTDYRDHTILLPRRWLMIALLLACAIGGGMLFRLKSDAQIMLQRANSMITAGLQAQGNDALPAPLRAPNVQDFNAHATQKYQLEWQNHNLNLYAIPRPATPEYKMAVVIARFDNGWNLVCLYPDTQRDPGCRGFDKLPRPESEY